MSYGSPPDGNAIPAAVAYNPLIEKSKEADLIKSANKSFNDYCIEIMGLYPKEQTKLIFINNLS